MTRSAMYLWAAALLLWAGALGAIGVVPQRILSLQAPLSAAVPSAFDHYVGTDVEIDPAEQRLAGFTEYLMRDYTTASGDAEEDAPVPGVESFSVYVGYYAAQTQGQTIHSPKNCLPGSGWEALESRIATVPTPDGPVGVNRYLIQNGDEQALVLYWYQGRGRVQASEYAVKWDLLRDAALRQRSDEALVRIVVPVSTSEDDSFSFAQTVAGRLVPALDRALPE